MHGISTPYLPMLLMYCYASFFWVTVNKTNYPAGIARYLCIFALWKATKAANLALETHTEHTQWCLYSVNNMHLYTAIQCKSALKVLYTTWQPLLP